jgi:hypothetical protein
LDSSNLEAIVNLILVNSVSTYGLPSIAAGLEAAGFGAAATVWAALGYEATYYGYSTCYAGYCVYVCSG